MNLKVLAVILLFALIGFSVLSRFVGSRQVAQSVAVNHSAEEGNGHTQIKDGEPIDFAVKQELRKEFTLKPGAVVYVYGINGKLDVTTSDTDKAEIYLVRSVRKAEDFDERQVRMRLGENESLEVEIHKNRRFSLWAGLGSSNEERQRLELKLPRNVIFHANQTNGNITIGELDNALLVEGLNGNVKAARAMHRGVFEDINGNVDATFASLTKGLAIQDINGNLDFHFTDAVNADVKVHGLSGKVNNELPNTTVRQEKQGIFLARIGNGGDSIAGDGINGDVNLLPVAKVASK